MNDQDALRAEAGKLAAEPAAASGATSWFELLYQAAARGEATIPWASLAHCTRCGLGAKLAQGIVASPRAAAG